MNREFLKGLGLDDEAIEKAMSEHGKTVNKAKDDLNAVTTERDNLKSQLTERDTQLTDLGKKVKDNEELTAEINRLKNENETSTTELQQKLDKQAKDFAIENALRDAKAKNPKLAKGALDLETITFKDGKLIGIDEQLKAVKESDAYLFGEDEPPGLKGRQPHAGATPSNGGKNPWSKENFNLTEQGRLLKDEPELAKQLQGQS